MFYLKLFCFQNFLKDNPQDVVYWQTQMELEFGTTEDDVASASATSTTNVSHQPPPNLKACRYGLTCTRADCKFWHPEPDESAAVSQSEDISNKCSRLGQSWIPHKVCKLHTVEHRNLNAFGFWTDHSSSVRDRTFQTELPKSKQFRTIIIF